MPVEVVRGTQPGKSSAGVPGDDDRVRLRVSVQLSLREKYNSHGVGVLSGCVRHSRYRDGVVQLPPFSLRYSKTCKYRRTPVLIPWHSGGGLLEAAVGGLGEGDKMGVK